MESLIETFIEKIGENNQREGLRKTPKRFLKAYEDLTKGYEQTHTSIVNGALFPAANDEMVVVQGIDFFSLCEHHLLPFFGRCNVAYLPNDKIIGLSKIPRLVEMYAKRLQVQEHLTQQIALAIEDVTDAKGVIVTVQARHCCVMMRGIKKQDSEMITSAKLGAFREDKSLVQEFWQLLQSNKG
jgi:GTP cyclohydrolase IA